LQILVVVGVAEVAARVLLEALPLLVAMAVLVLLVRFPEVALYTLLVAVVVPVTLAHLQEQVPVYMVYPEQADLLVRVVLVVRVISDAMHLVRME
jgi:hypothetical protein